MWTKHPVLPVKDMKDVYNWTGWRVYKEMLDTTKKQHNEKIFLLFANIANNDFLYRKRIKKQC